jgi:hypothetical protein
VETPRPATNALEPTAPVQTTEAQVPTPDEPVDPELQAKIQRENDYLTLYDQLRLMLQDALLPLVGEKKAKNMLSRTLEATRNKYPEYFRNANWDPEGNLLEDGSMDQQRLIQNKSHLDPTKADEVQDLALKSLLETRLTAIEKGLGADLRAKLLTQMTQWCSTMRQQEAAKGSETVFYDRLMALLG